MKKRLDTELVSRGLVVTRSQAENYIRLGCVFVNGSQVKKPGFFISEADKLELKIEAQYVSRAGLKLASVASDFHLDFRDKVVLDIGSCTGGFTDYALQNGAKKVIAVDVGTNQLHPSLRQNPKIELREQTDIRDVKKLSSSPDIIVVDVSFISLQEVLPHAAKLARKNTLIIAMAKPQFEAKNSKVKHKGVIKNEAVRRQILKEFEVWSKKYFFVENKKDSSVSGEKGNTERFYLFKKLNKANL